jgi:flagellar basal body-associated protein FliL
MSKKNIIIALVTFIVAFAATFYIIRTYFPKHKVEQTTTVKDTLTKPQ